MRRNFRRIARPPCADCRLPKRRPPRQSRRRLGRRLSPLHDRLLRGRLRFRPERRRRLHARPRARRPLPRLQPPHRSSRHPNKLPRSALPAAPISCRIVPACSPAARRPCSACSAIQRSFRRRAGPPFRQSPKVEQPAPAAAAATATAPAPAAAPFVPRRLRLIEELAILKSCGADQRAFCAGVAPGGGRVIGCLAQNASSLSPQCAGALAAAR